MNGAAPPLSSSLNFRLSLMMFLQYAIWGAWLPLMWTFLQSHRGFQPEQIGMMFTAGGVGAVIAPFIAGQIADRWFNTEKFLAVSHLIGAALVWQLASIETYDGFLRFSLAYSLVYSPTLSLTNSLAFHHLPDRDRDFGKVRSWGTLGWILVGIGIGQWLLHRHTPEEASVEVVKAAQAAGIGDAFRLSAILGAAMGLFCFTLPKTPPAQGKQDLAVTKALSEVFKQPLVTLFLLAIPVSCIHQFYFIHTAPFLGNFQSEMATQINSIFGVGGGGLMTIGQMSEFMVLGLIPLVAKSCSRKTLLAIGLCAYAARMALFAYVAPLEAATGIPQIALLILGIAMHGVCFGCFIFVAFMVIDENTTVDVRATAQSLFGLVVFGVGIIVGSMVAGKVATYATSTSVIEVTGEGMKTISKTDFTELFSIPMWGAVACLLALLLLYPSRKSAPN
jgi:nucleoside transporter